MIAERRIKDHEAWQAARLPGLRAIRCAQRNVSVRRPPCMRVQNAEQVRVLHRCRERRLARLARAGVLVHTDSRTKRLTLPSAGQGSASLRPEG